MKNKFSLARSHNLVEKTDRQPAIAERQTQRERTSLRCEGRLKGVGVSQAKEEEALGEGTKTRGNLEEF